jgi:hypothetical protein
MRTPHTPFALAVTSILAFATLPACEKKPAAKPAANPNAHADHDHDHADDHGHAHDADHGTVVELGEQTAGPFTIKAARTGDFTPGADTPIDAVITGTPKISAVRFWIGTADAKGSVKAKADLEKDTHHAHVEIPKPLPDASELWIEIEAEGGEKSTAHFNLKR